MDLFDTGFTLLMILFPAVFTLFVRQRETQAETRALNKKLTGLLWLASAIAIGFYALLFRWNPALAYFMWLAFFPLWFLFAMPVLRTRNAGWGQPEPGALRSASLVRRDELPRGLRTAWIGLTLVWILLLVASIYGLASDTSGAAHWWLPGFNLVAGGELWLLHWAMRRSLIEPEPVSLNESPQLRAERERFRRFKLGGWFALAAIVMLIFSLPPVLLIWLGGDVLTLVIIIGAGGGSLAGIGGGVFGTMASIKRAKINRLYAEASVDDSA